MKKILLWGVLTALCCDLYAWAPAGDKMKTRWAADVTPENVWQSYPRPQLRRAAWQNLNGLWEYAVTDAQTTKEEVAYEGEILVPFAIESSLSGVQRTFLPTDRLWYRRTFEIDPDWRSKRVMLHFGAVDYRCEVWVNNRLVGTHTGGNNPFGFDITAALRKRGPQLLELRVADPTDTESITRGKQQLKQKGVWYTPVSGIWKTVWLEAVNPTHVTRVLNESDAGQKNVSFRFEVAQARGNERLEVEILDGNRLIRRVEMPANETVNVALPECERWTPATPHLYRLEVALLRGRETLDRVSSYFALREVSVGEDAEGNRRVCLNGEPVFQLGSLDQGWWPDGLLTPPSEEAMLWDMVQLKRMGFNTIRKHIKVEPELYYYYADSLGLMIWQDMVSGFATSRSGKEHVKADWKEDWNAPQEHSRQWQGELFEMIDRLRFYPSITTWVVFNEGWGQHNTVEIVNKVQACDTSRIIDGVTGWADRGVGQMYDVHNYPATAMILPAENGGRISALGEFGGYGWAVDDHLWAGGKPWGYKNIDGATELIDNYGRLMYDLETLIAQGLGAAIYTQTTDVEGEVNGLITYDREVVKVPVGLLHAMHHRLYGIESAGEVVELGAWRWSEPSDDAAVTVNGKEPGTARGELAAGDKVTVRSRFQADKTYGNLSLWVQCPGKMRILLNGIEVFCQDVRQTRHPNQYNISDYAPYLREGENLVEIEAEITRRTSALEYELRAY